VKSETLHQTSRVFFNWNFFGVTISFNDFKTRNNKNPMNQLILLLWKAVLEILWVAIILSKNPLFVYYWHSSLRCYPLSMNFFRMHVIVCNARYLQCMLLFGMTFIWMCMSVVFLVTVQWPICKNMTSPFSSFMNTYPFNTSLKKYILQVTQICKILGKDLQWKRLLCSIC